ncbi:hypothetical protein [Bradyrhizobium sp. 5.13L]
MDEDAKTLLAVLALLYGSSNGVGLFKSALDPVQADAKDLKKAIKDVRSDDTFIANQKWKLFKSLWSYGVLVYLLLVLLPPAFVVLVIVYGAEGALHLIGLGVAGANASAPGLSPFYIVLFIFLALSSLQLLSGYFSAWRIILTFRPKSDSPES